jgi:hypothetical protein
MAAATVGSSKILPQDPTPITQRYLKSSIVMTTNLTASCWCARSATACRVAQAHCHSPLAVSSSFGRTGPTPISSVVARSVLQARPGHSGPVTAGSPASSTWRRHRP